MLPARVRIGQNSRCSSRTFNAFGVKFALSSLAVRNVRRNAHRPILRSQILQRSTSGTIEPVFLGFVEMLVCIESGRPGRRTFHPKKVNTAAVLEIGVELVAWFRCTLSAYTGSDRFSLCRTSSSSARLRFFVKHSVSVVLYKEAAVPKHISVKPCNSSCGMSYQRRHQVKFGLFEMRYRWRLSLCKNM
jgi:hypothetical protein